MRDESPNCYTGSSDSGIRGSSPMKRMFTASLWREDDWYIAQCLEVDVASQGTTEDEALSNLREAIELHFEEPIASEQPRVRTVEVDIDAA